MVRTRIAPSPTGKNVHVGSISTALMNYAWAKKHYGQFIIRIEDTDQSRLVGGSEKRMLDTFEALGLRADESPLVGGPYAPYRQSERLTIYKHYAEELVKKGKAYYCICTPQRLEEIRKQQQAKKQIPKYDRHCLNEQDKVIKEIKKGAKFVIRILMPDEEVAFDDIIRGHIVIKGSNLDDQVLLKSDGFPTYHLGVVVDDHLMKITHVIRGEEWLPSTPKHIVLFKAFGWELPQFAHVPLLRNPDKSKLSKRKNPVWASDYINQGILPEALLNYLSLMGWSHPEGKEIFTLDEYIKLFDIKDVQTTAPVFDPVKLEWMNGEYVRRTQNSKLKTQILDFYKKYQNKNLKKNLVEKTIPLIKERIKKLSDYMLLCEFFFQEPDQYDLDLSSKKSFFSEINKKLQEIKNWKAEEIGKTMQDLAQKLGIKNSEFFMFLRVAITGKKITPPLNESMELLGKEKCIKRVCKLI